ncbi:MipA/OmpV family protein [Kordiimonas sp. SCSIO 12603]|uniref:MipA/OmpV family protein n=1 Tax=Kordiimonas sp. SCSIO 12603 TaxID=2829596 RepID=UPI0021042E1B|nr:MipA/OmpV family protein [Kordiimonas sp. SCSIO 12603]UTW57668.1 MipA/OmpV family protein [Kordiimonas sp. SCSIO 12603]
MEPVRSTLWHVCVLVVLVFLSTSAYGQTASTTIGKPNYIESVELETERKKDRWGGQIGFGLGLAPQFIGSSRYDVQATLDINVTWNDTVFIEGDRAGVALYKSRFLRAGPIARWNLGRANDLVADINSGETLDTFELGAFAGTSFYKLFLSAEAYWGVSGAHRGSNIEAEMGYTFELNSGLRVTPIVGANWGSQKFNQVFFGVEEDSVLFEPFRAKAGIYELYAEAAVEQRLGKNWLIKGTVRLSDLKNSAADSTITRSEVGERVQFSSFFGVVWLF